MPPRHRNVSPQEVALWGAWAERAGVAPMPGKALPPTPARPPPVVAAAVPPGAAPAPAVRRPPPWEIAVGAPPPGIDSNRWKDLRRGRTRPERTLDLHGRTAQQAHGAVRAFLAGAAHDGLRCVCIVTGKGAVPHGGVLKRELPFWLNAADLRPLVLALAHPHAANSGSVHVLLRRRRS
ncbi:Smr/MutS family protein [Humitalea sp. 24SJ18S-53]|uniref:Smr/MutS family protein n=1 Tax=Humitalea sp. 24SJ18S-53 TaxID=3422307 RepID=UPI003D66C5CE